MATLTVEKVAKMRKITPDELIEKLVSAGIKNKTADSEISTAEVKMALVQKKPAAKIDIKKSEGSAKTSVAKVQTIKSSQAKKIVNSDEAKEALEALEAGRRKSEEESAKDSKRQQIVGEKIEADNAAKRQELEESQKKEAEALAIKKEEEAQAIRAAKIKKQKEIREQQEKDKQNRNNRRNNTTNRPGNRPPASRGRKEPKLKKKDRSKLSQKLKEEQDQHGFQKPVEKIVLDIAIPENIKVSDLALQMKTKAAVVVKTMMGMGVMATINDSIDQDTAMLVVEEMGHNPTIDKGETIEDTLVRKKDNVGETRAPIVTIMGHVDHGKTSLLDYIRKAKVADGEAGGITQHIGAYQVKSDNGLITFIDTPGHAAFGKMRERGANTTDIVILVVAADDGVMPQTIQSIEYAKKAGVPMIVAVNKIDKEGANVDKVKQILSTHDVVAEDWGGDVIISPVSAHTGEGIDDLLNNITLTAEILELKAEVDTPAHGVVMEAKVDKGRGKVIDILVQSGTLKQGDIVIAGLEYGKVKRILDDSGNVIKTAGPSMPVEILGITGVPDSGDEVLVVENEKKAREVADFRKTEARDKLLQKQQAEKMENFLKKMEEGDVSIVNVMVKADVRGSAQAIVDSLEELSTDEVRIKIVSSGVGAISNNDVILANTSDALILGFNVRADSVARRDAGTMNVKIEYYSIIYNLIDDVKAIMSGHLKPELSENIIGMADVKDVFRSQKLGDIAGCMITEGVVRKDSPIRVLRDSIVVFEGELESLRRFKDDVKEVQSGTECGIGVAGYDVEKGDQIEVFERIEIARTL
jgi:translation initiation factor IF-2